MAIIPSLQQRVTQEELDAWLQYTQVDDDSEAIGTEIKSIKEATMVQAETLAKPIKKKLSAAWRRRSSLDEDNISDRPCFGIDARTMLLAERVACCDSEEDLDSANSQNAQVAPVRDEEDDVLFDFGQLNPFYRSDHCDTTDKLTGANGNDSSSRNTGQVKKNHFFSEKYSDWVLEKSYDNDTCKSSENIPGVKMLTVSPHPTSHSQLKFGTHYNNNQDDNQGKKRPYPSANSNISNQVTDFCLQEEARFSRRCSVIKSESKVLMNIQDNAPQKSKNGFNITDITAETATNSGLSSLSFVRAMESSQRSQTNLLNSMLPSPKSLAKLSLQSSTTQLDIKSVMAAHLQNHLSQTMKESSRSRMVLVKVQRKQMIQNVMQMMMILNETENDIHAIDYQCFKDGNVEGIRRISDFSCDDINAIADQKRPNIPMSPCQESSCTFKQKLVTMQQDWQNIVLEEISSMKQQLKQEQSEIEGRMETAVSTFNVLTTHA